MKTSEENEILQILQVPSEIQANMHNLDLKNTDLTKIRTTHLHFLRKT